MDSSEQCCWSISDGSHATWVCWTERKSCEESEVKRDDSESNNSETLLVAYSFTHVADDADQTTASSTRCT